MRQSDEFPLDPDIATDLEVIDATLGGLIVDPAHTELAEITLLLAAERQPPPEEVARRLDARVDFRFAPERDRRPRRHQIFLRSALGGGTAAFAAAVAAVAVLSNGSPTENLAAVGNHGASTNSGAPLSPRAGVPATARSPRALQQTHSPGVAAPSIGPNRPAKTLDSIPAANPVAGGAIASPNAPSPLADGRRIVQSADLELTSANAHVADVGQEVFNVVSQVNGFVVNSSVTAASGNQGYASFTLSIPSGNLQRAITRMSSLQYAHVSSRTDGTQDVNNQYLSDVRRLQDARTLRTSLLKQLASAYTTTQIQSVTAQIHDAEASISSDEATLHGLAHRIGFSRLTVEINAGPIYVPVAKPHTTSSGFTLGRAVHDSVRVLTVAAGVALIALAALIPFALLIALAAWIGYWMRRRRRAHVLDVA
jgi:hypothetical protein